MSDLIRYDAARHALQEASRIDEVMDIKDRAVALVAYCRQARDPELIERATDIKLRAERKAGQLLISMKINGERQPAARPTKHRKEPTDSPPKTLADLEISKDQSSRWQGIAMLAEKAFEARVEEAKAGARRSIEATPAEKAQAKKDKRAAREVELGAKQRALPSERFGVIVADPEWQFQPWSSETGMDRAAGNHYPTSELQAIMTRDVASIAADDCVLFLWTTRPMLTGALSVLNAWGFSYKTCCGWAKDRVGTGYWFRDNLELLLVGTQGQIPAPAPGTQWLSLIEAAVGKHSEKPEIFLVMIEELFPNLPKIELNRRGPAREGWAAWGLEAGIE